MSDLVFRNARLIDPASGYDDMGDLLVQYGKISQFGDVDAPDNVQEIEADGRILSPGLIDMRVVSSETRIDQTGNVAAAGGFTTIVIMPQTGSILDDTSKLDYLLRKGAEGSPINVYGAGALTHGLLGQAMTDIGLMGDAGALFFSNGDNPIANSRLMRRLLSYSSAFNALIASRPLDPDMSAGTCAHESDFSARLGLPGHPPTAERIIAERDIALAELTGGRLLIDMVSSREGAEVLRQAGRRDLEVYASVTINHLSLNELDIGEYRTFAKLDPPLREESDRKALLAAVNDGTIDVIVSSHDPRMAGEKRRPYTEAGAGAIGLETLLGAGLTLVDNEELDLMAMLRALTCNPAELLGLASGKLAEGAPADLVLIDPNAPWVVNPDHMTSRAKNTPFEGRRFIGRADMTVCGGDIVFDRLGA
ncbi:amidohydrolase family protein [Robiginitomaculum antarcticum]|uniref:amidohydrolase family protein n=1 Tax=Robiginitomaculum antarcticum TaxID=437507 RepID=UPI000377405C|nr:amidohydrolase family protein [Robiginitomaculum antarcticum]